jgi:excisionase family DNA binding protein
MDGTNNPLLTIPQAAEVLGVHRSTVDSLIKRTDSRFPYARLSERVIRIDRDKLFEWVRSGGLDGSSNHDQ